MTKKNPSREPGMAPNPFEAFKLAVCRFGVALIEALERRRAERAQAAHGGSR